MSIPRKIGYAVLSVDGNDTSEQCSEIESLATTEADSWDEVARPTDSPISTPGRPDNISSESKQTEFGLLLDTVQGIHITLRRLAQQQSAVLDALRLTYADTAEHQKEALIRLKRISRNTERYAYADGEGGCSTVVGAPAVKH